MLMQKHPQTSKFKAALMYESDQKHLLQCSSQSYLWNGQDENTLTMQLLEERDAELERSEASLEGHKKAADVREAVSTLHPLCIKAKRSC